jgi:hypothetical protein
MRILDASGCEIGYADDELTCTYPPAEWACPGERVSLKPKSTYQVWVTAMGDCAGTYAEYELTVEMDAGGDPALTLVTDDATSRSTVITSTASIHIP